MSSEITDDEKLDCQMCEKLEKYKILYQAYADEIRNLWQRSVFLATFMVLVWTGYGALQLKSLGKDFAFVSSHNLLSIGLCVVIIILSLLWIAMAKGSKFIQQAHEEHIKQYDKCNFYCNIDSYEEMLEKELCNNLVFSGTLKAYRYSPSKINIALGCLSAMVAAILCVIHTIFIMQAYYILTLKIAVWIIIFLIAVIFLIMFLTPCLIKKRLKGKNKIHKIKQTNKKGAKMAKHQPKTTRDLILLANNPTIKLSDIDTSHITNMNGIFYNSKRTDFSGIDTWNTSNVVSMKFMFAMAENFNEPLNSWDTSKVTDMACMFSNAAKFNQPLDKWNVSNVEDMTFMFHNAIRFNQNIEKWNVKKVKKMSGMFHSAKEFNQPLNSWNVSNVECMARMFEEAIEFNQPLNKWAITKVTRMLFMFAGAENFEQDISNWNVSKNLCDTNFMFFSSALERLNKLPQWY